MDRRADVSFWSENPHWSDEETDSPLYAGDRNFYKVKKWIKDGTKVDRLLYARNNLGKTREISARPSSTGREAV
jgi:hypothetical protein